jgi:dephospho-CoA kinase
LFVLGVVGPIAAGKNAVTGILEKHGFAVIDADSLVHRIIDEKQQQILAAFSPIAIEKGVNLLTDGKINRAVLGKILFADENALKKQEAIVHPEVNRLFVQFIAENAGRPVALNATLLYKVPVFEQCRAILYVDALRIQRYFRIKKRNKLKATEIFARFHSQSHIFSQYSAKSADIYRVWNIGKLGCLEKKIDIFLRHCEEKGYEIWNKNNHYGLSQQ